MISRLLMRTWLTNITIHHEGTYSFTMKLTNGIIHHKFYYEILHGVILPSEEFMKKIEMISRLLMCTLLTNINIHHEGTYSSTMKLTNGIIHHEFYYEILHGVILASEEFMNFFLK